MRKRLRKKLARKKADQRLRQLILYVCWKYQSVETPEPLTFGKLQSVLYLIDVAAFRALGYPLTGRLWRKVPDGVEMAGYWEPSAAGKLREERSAVQQSSPRRC